MKQKDNIEQQFSQLKKHYKVPDNYFENLHIDANKLPAKQGEILQKKVWLIAAMIVLLVSLGYKVFNWSQTPVKQPVLSPNQIAQNDDLFNDLSDDEIIEYLIDEDFVEQNF